MEAVICFSHLRWNFVFQRPQHLMVRFARNHRVFYIEEPVDAGPDEQPHVQRWTHPESGVQVITPSLPAGSEADRRQQMRDIVDALLLEHEIAYPVLWYYTPLMRAFSSHLDASCIVYDCMDELANFKFAPPALAACEQELLANADVVFTGGISLFESKRERHHNVRVFPSSVDADHFRTARDRSLEDAADQAHLPHPRFGFHGVIDERMDLELLAGIADARPDWTWIMVGPVVKIDPADLPRRPNIHYLGAKSYQELPKYLAGWDVAIMPFAINAATRFISPTKTPEYFAGGLPVVSTPVPDVLRRYGNLMGLRVGATVAEFVQGCEQALVLRGRPDDWMGDVDRVLSLDSWDTTFNEMHAAVATAIAPPPKEVQQIRAAHPRQNTPLYDYLIVGAGFAGSVLAERLAAESGRKVLVIDRRPHIGGNAYDEYDDAGILVHKYGPHIFHTNSDRILTYLSRFTEWRPYEHRVLASARGKLVPIPINRTTLNIMYDLNLTTDAEVAAFLQSKAVPVADIKSAEDLMLSTVGPELYETFFRTYTQKQWGMDPSMLDKSVTARVPTRTSTDDRYFTDKHQCMPLHGYTRMFENMLSHENITVMTGVDFASVRKEGLARHTIFSGPIDEYFDYRYGKLGYRSLEFRRATIDKPRFQPVGVVNYPSADVPYTRITEYTHLTGQRSTRTSLTYEYPCAEGEPYYPVPTAANQALYQRYVALAATVQDVTFAGRLGTYRYYNMDQIVGQALSTYQRLEDDPAKVPLRQNLLLRAYV